MGADGTLWGGEAFTGSPGAWRRVGSLRQFRVTGGDLVGREPWRSAAALCWETAAGFAPNIPGAELVRQAWERGLNTVATSSVGRLFDAASALVLGLNATSFEGQGPMMLESLAQDCDEAVDLDLVEADGALRIDWAPLLPMLADTGIAPSGRASIFHESVARALVRQADVLAMREKVDAIGLTGGVFQNRRLTERVANLLRARSLDVRVPARLPPNDGGLAFGQLVEALHTGVPTTESLPDA